MANVPALHDVAEPISAPSKSASGSPSAASLTPEIVLALALAVAAPRARAHLYDGTSNSLKGWTSIEQAAADEVAFVVRLAEHIVGIDLDKPHEVALLGDLLVLLQQRGLRPVVLASGQDNRRHVFVRVEPTDRRMVEQAVGGLLGSREPVRRDIRPPLSPHRLGLPVRLVKPVNVQDVLADLAPAAAPRRRLSAKAIRLLRTGGRPGEYASRSNVLMSVVTSMIQARWSYEAVLKTLLDPANAAGEKVRQIRDERGRQAAERYVEGRYVKAVEFVRENPGFACREDVVVALVEHRLRVQEWAWSGSWGQKQRVMLTAVLDVTVSIGSVEAEPSHRRLAQEAGLSRNTTEKVLTSLVKEGWLKCSPRGRGKSNRYRINLKKEGTIVEPLPTSPGGGCEGSGSELDPNHDAFRHGGGLGKSGYTLLSHLHEPLTAADLTLRTGIPASTVKRVLRTLVEARVVEKVDAQYEAQKGSLLAVRLGVLARRTGQHLGGMRQRAAHQQERDQRASTGPASSEEHKHLHAAPDARLAHGLLDPLTGDFRPRRRLPRHSEGSLGCGPVGPLVIVLPVEGYTVALREGREVVFAATHDAASRRFEVFPSSFEMEAVSDIDIEEHVQVFKGRAAQDSPGAAADA